MRDERTEQYREQGPEGDAHLASLRGELAKLDEPGPDIRPLRIHVEAAHLAQQRERALDLAGVRVEVALEDPTAASSALLNAC